MPSEDSIVNEWVEAEGEKFRLLIDGVLQEDGGRFDLTVRIIDGATDQDVSVVKLEATITNPIDVVAIIFVAAKLYGLCVVSGVIGSIGKVIYQEYQNSVADDRGLRGSDRALDVYNRVKRKHGDLKAEAVKALLTCLPKTSG